MQPKCRYFGVCGGCQNQHIEYSEQLENKRKRLAYLLQTQYQGEIKVFSEQPYGYRNRMDFIVSQSTIGFRQSDERKLVDVTECPISETKLNALLHEVREFLNGSNIERFDRKNRSGVLRYAVIRVANNSSISFVLNEDSSKLSATIDQLKEYAQKSSAENILIAYTKSTSDESVSLECFAIKGDEYLISTFCNKQISYHSQAFFQNNATMAAKMVNYCADIIKTKNGLQRTLIDAYGGVGTFGVVLAEHAKKVISIESHPLGTQACQRNIEINEIKNMIAINEDAGNLKKLDIDLNGILLLDPPRSGLGDKMLRYILEKKPQTIIYVSCNPSQLAKELTQLARHYNVENVALFDLFPQTNHMEGFVVLEKKM